MECSALNKPSAHLPFRPTSAKDILCEALGLVGTHTQRLTNIYNSVNIYIYIFFFYFLANLSSKKIASKQRPIMSSYVGASENLPTCVPRPGNGTFRGKEKRTSGGETKN